MLVRIPAACLLALPLFLLAGCSSGPEEEPERVIAEAYAGPAKLKLHQEVDPRSPVSATVKHGDKLLIVRRRRRFVRVRTPGGAAGWTELRQLLAASEMEKLDGLAQKSRALPSQGAATVYDGLNVHTEPNRLSPSFYRIEKGEAVDVVEHQLAPRAAYDPQDVIPPPPPRQPRARKPKEQPRVPSIQPPPAPKLPDNWIELSRTATPEPETPPPPPPPAKPVPVDDWSLVRLKNGRAGWVLTGMLRMEIPDEVAQYSEGARITAYFSMADVSDEGQVRHHWLWTTLSQTRSPYDFDSFRYFIWNTRRHRYETAYIEKNLTGYFPVEVGKVKMTVNKKEDTFPSFSLVLADATGSRWKKTYAFQYYRVVLIGKEPYQPTPEAAPERPAPAAAEAPAPAPERPGLLARIKNSVAGLRRKVFGK